MSISCGSFRRSPALFVALLTLGIGSCASARPSTESPSHAWAARLAELPSPEPSWEEMSLAEKNAWMAQEVVPIMRELFQEHDESTFANFGCASCHGSDMAARSFAMPSPELMALSPTGSPEQRQMVRDHPQILRLMYSRVVPAMERLLGAESFDADTSVGFSCFACHPRAE